MFLNPVILDPTLLNSSKHFDQIRKSFPVGRLKLS